MKTHFVTRLVVERIDAHEGTGRGDDKKFKTTVANIVVSAGDLDSLKRKASAHLDLVEDGGDINERVTR